MKLFNRRYTPLLIYILYVSFVFCALFLSPLKYVDIELPVLVFFMIGVVVFFFVGYVMTVSGHLNSAYEFKSFLTSVPPSVQFLSKALLVLGLITVAVDWVGFLQASSSSSFSSLGDSYINSYDGYERGQAKVDLFYILRILSHTVLALCLAFSSYYFSSYSTKMKLGFLFVILSYLVIQVLGSGKQKYLGDCVIAFGVFILFFRARQLKINKAKLLFFIGIGGVLVFYFFIEILKQRYVAAGIGVENINEKVHPLIYWELDSFVFDFIGDEYGFALAIFLGYFTNGLYGLSLCLQLPFQWSYMVGNSYSLTRIVEIIMGEDKVIYSVTYPYRAGLEFGWGETKWHSLFSWMASDISFFGVIIFSGLFGAFYGLLWRQSINFSNPISGPLFSLLTLGLIFSLANNQLMHSLSGILSLVTLLLLWIFWPRIKKN
jgi:hypothetical protein